MSTSLFIRRTRSLSPSRFSLLHLQSYTSLKAFCKNNCSKLNLSVLFSSSFQRLRYCFAFFPTAVQKKLYWSSKPCLLFPHADLIIPVERRGVAKNVRDCDPAIKIIFNGLIMMIFEKRKDFYIVVPIATEYLSGIFASLHGAA